MDTAFLGGTYEENWNEQGGWSSVWTNIGVGLIGSAGGEAFDNVNFRKVNTNDVNIEGSSIFSKFFKKAGDLDNTSSGNYFRPAGDLDLGISESVLKKLDEFKRVMNNGTYSDPRVVDLAATTFENAIRSGNPNAELILNRVIDIKNNNPNFNLNIDPAGGCFWSNSRSLLAMAENKINWGDSGTFSHELGHSLFSQVLYENLPNDWIDISARARVYSSNNATLSQVGNELTQQGRMSYVQAKNNYKVDLKAVGYSSIDEYVKAWSNSIEAQMNQYGQVQTIDNLRKQGFNEETLKMLQDPNVSALDVANSYVNSEIRTRSEQIDRIQYGDNCAVSDIIDALYMGTQKDLKGKPINVTYQHGQEYYINSGNPDTFSFHEIIANFTQLKLTGNQASLDKIRTIFGNEFYNTLENTFNSFLIYK